MTEALTETLTADASFELLSLECRVDTDGAVRYYTAQGQLHRVYGPAVIYVDGHCSWYQNGQRHREGGPAVIYADGTRTWYHKGQRHRVDGPAVEYADGTRTWYHKGRRHRVDGPAIERPDGYCAWYIDGKVLTKAEWQQVVASMEHV
jgi:hypothetical protein